MIERIESHGELLAMVIRAGYKPEHTHFVTSEKEGLQLGFHARKQGERVKAHRSLHFDHHTQHPLCKIYYLQNGKATIDMYDRQDQQISVITIHPGDTIIFFSGGHGLTFMEDSQMIEVKQGPYRQRDNEKRFLE